MSLEPLSKEEQKQASDLEYNLNLHIISSDPNEKSVYIMEQHERQYAARVYESVTRKMMKEKDFKSITMGPVKGMVIFEPQ